MACTLDFGFLCGFDRQTLAKRLHRPHLRQSAPTAGHVCCLLCPVPHLPHWYALLFFSPSNALTSALSDGGLVPRLSVRVLMWAAVDLLAQHMSIAVWRVRSAWRRSLLHVLSLMIPPMMQSQIRPSESVLNSQDLALVLRSVTYWSIVSPGCWFLTTTLK